MKQRKSKDNNPKRITFAENQQSSCPPISHVIKKSSSYGKMSTIHSSTQNVQGVAINKKQKKIQNKNSKESHTNKGKTQSKFKSSNLKLNQVIQNINQPQESYRQYCLVDLSFIPVIQQSDKRIIEDMLFQTASTDFNHNNHSSTLARKKAKNILDGNLGVQKIDISTSMNQIKKKLASQEINAVPECLDIGLQYSERQQDKQNLQIKPNRNQPISIIAQNQSLPQLFFKIQFSHLANQESFSSLTNNQKEHFSQLLQALSIKLTGNQSKLIKNNYSYRPPSSAQHSQQVLKTIFEDMQKQICLRQYRQMNWIQSQPTKQQNQINSNIFSVINFLCHLFCHIQDKYSQEFVYLIQKVYGYPYKERYRRITRNIPFIPDRKFRVIDESIFLDFVNQNNPFSNANEIVHCKAIFDAFNEHLDEYRPFFLGNGQQFPWVFKMFPSMSEYAINEESLQIIFLQSKEKMIEWCSQLCGLMIEREGETNCGSPLDLKRAEREDREIRTWIRKQNFQLDEIQLFSTQALHQISQIIYQQILGEITEDCIFF